MAFVLKKEGEKVNTTVELTTIECRCGGVYAITEKVRKQTYERCGGGWHCPYCRHEIGYFDNSEKDKLERELRNAKKREQWAREAASQARKERDLAKRQASAQKAAKTRIKNRVARGVCPCCNRSFANLAAHMNTKHPGYAGSGE